MSVLTATETDIESGSRSRIAIMAVTAKGAALGQQVAAQLRQSGDAVVCYEKSGRESSDEAIVYTSLKPMMEEIFNGYDRLLFIMATGIVVRMIAPYVVHKSSDPAVVVMDEGAHHAISLLSGHLGGANEWTAEIAQIAGADPVITTATDVNGLPAPDVLARKLGLAVDDFTDLRHVNAAIVAGEPVRYYLDTSLSEFETYREQAMAYGIKVVPFDGAACQGDDLPRSNGDKVDSVQRTDRVKSTGDNEGDIVVRIIITDRVMTVAGTRLFLRPKTMTVGIGCRRDTPAEMIEAAVLDSLANLGRSPKSVYGAASVIVKADEKGLLAAMKRLGWPIQFYTQEEMKPLIAAADIEESNFVKQTIGVGNVCETTAMLLAKSRELWQKKTVYPRTTVAIARVR